jgi:dienelactone hydrolase
MTPVLALLLLANEGALDELQERARRSLDAITHAGTLEEAAARRDEMRARLRHSLGLDLLPRDYQLKSRAVGTIVRPGYRIEKVVYETLPGVLVPAHLYLPAKAGGRAPAILFYIGHWWADSKMRPDFQAFCINMARFGFAVLSWDPFGQGERGVSSRDHRRTELLLMGIAQQGIAEYETQAALRYLLSRPEVDPQRIGMTGASGGGYNTWITSALDDRVRVAVPVVGTSDFYEQIAVTRPLDWYRAAEHCHFVPQLIRYANNHELLAMSAPKPLLIIAASKDQSFPIEGVKRVAEYGRGLYASDRIGFFEDTVEGHGYQIRKREAAYGWFLRWLMGRGDGTPFKEPPVETAAVDDPEYRCLARKHGAGPGLAAYARVLAARPRRQPWKVSEVLGIAPPQRSARTSSSANGCTLLTVADNGSSEFPRNALPERGWRLQPARVRGLNGDVVPQPGWTAAVSLLLGENFVARQAEDLETALRTAGDCVAVYAHGHNASLAATYAAARDPRRAAWILRDGFITYRHFIDRPAEAVRSFELKTEDRDRTTWFDREIPFAYVPFGALRYFDLPDLLAPAASLLIINPIDGNWKTLTKPTATRWTPKQATLIVEQDPSAALRKHLEAWRASRNQR